MNHSEELLTEYFANKGFKNKKAISNYERECKRLMEFTNKELLEITREDAIAYTNEMVLSGKYSTNTIYSKLRTLNAVFNYISDTVDKKHNVFATIPIPDRNIVIDNIVEEDAVGSILRKARMESIRDLTFILLAYRLGAYPRALSELRLKDVFQTEDRRYAVVLYAGTIKEVKIPMPSDVNKVLDEYIIYRTRLCIAEDHLFLTPQNKPINDRYAERMLKKYDPSMTYTKLRQLSACKMVKNNVEQSVIRDILGITNNWAFRYVEGAAHLGSSPLEDVPYCNY